MIFELTNDAGIIELNKWYRIHATNGVVTKDPEYIRFVFAWRRTGDKIFTLPSGETVFVDLEFSSSKYP